MQTKICTKCGLEKGQEEFPRSKKHSSGRASWCKACMLAYDRQRREQFKSKFTGQPRVTERKCSRCQQTKSSSEFNLSSSAIDGLTAACKQCVREWHLLRAYGVSADWYYDALRRQGGVCAICGRPEQFRSGFLAVDHDHLSGAVRQLLCSNCNAILGHCGDDEHILLRAVEYIRLHRTEGKTSE